MKLQVFIFLAVTFVVTTSGQSELSSEPSLAKPASLKLQDCEVPGTDEGKTEKVLCGSYEVFENRAVKSGRRITLKIVVFPATGRDKAPDPVFYIPGGPGSSSTEDAPYIAEDLAKVREHRDLVFVDQRGTGGSNPLNCTFFDPKDLQSYLGHWNPLEDVRECRTQLEAKADLSLYVTSIAVDDLDEVRLALGYDRINLAGSSYGTRASQEYIRRHGKNVRTAFLHGVSLTGQFMPRDFPQHNEMALRGVIEECAADKDCRSAFPDLKAEVKMVLAKLIKGAIEVDVMVEPKKTTRVRLSRDLAGEAVRYMLYQSGSAARVPLILHLAAQGNFTPLAEAAIFYRQRIVATGANGMYLSVTCAEDLPWIKPGEGERNAANTFLGDYRLRQQREACALWPRGTIPKDYSATIRSQVPALIVTGQWDPVTPPLYGDALSKNMPNSLHVVVPSGGHGFGGLEGIDCISRITADFIEKGATRGLDTPA
ncbi:MAG: alpha/beta hydrolase [Blastocatellia bacterium]|nr:alpha/beta hydrolase [Blastocatellia bacterium]